MSTEPGAPSPRAIPVAPTEDEWRALSLDQRARLLDDILDALSDPRAAMSEGRPHKKAKTRSLDMLGLHFGAVGRVVYLAEEMAVLYPGEEVFTPDVLAVIGVAEPEDDQRMAWVVADEGRGLDLVLEVLHRGNRKKDLEDNVERYARLGIPEYFVYDRAHDRIRGFRLPVAGAKRYVPIVPQGGRYASVVLGIDLAVEGGELRFFYGMAELFGSAELIRRLTDMVREREAQTERAEGQAERAEGQVEQIAAKAQQAVAGLRAGIVAALGARGIAVVDEDRARVDACEDPARLQAWLLRALMATSAEDVFSAQAGG
jgi:Uma2 family endonuclease